MINTQAALAVVRRLRQKHGPAGHVDCSGRNLRFSDLDYRTHEDRTELLIRDDETILLHLAIAGDQVVLCHCAASDAPWINNLLIVLESGPAFSVH